MPKYHDFKGKQFISLFLLLHLIHCYVREKGFHDAMRNAKLKHCISFPD